MNSTETGQHLSDAELIRYLDEAGDADESARWRRHVEACRACEDALRTARNESRLVSEWLDRAAFEAGGPTNAPGRTYSPGRLPRRSTVAPWLRAAALFVVLAAPLAAFPGVRAWVAEAVVGPAAPVAQNEGTITSAATPTVLRFVPAAGEFVVRFEPAGAGVITIERSADPEAELRAEGGEPEATISPSLLRIRNPEPARYRLRVPAATTGVWVMVGQRAVAVSDRQIDRRMVIELTGE